MNYCIDTNIFVQILRRRPTKSLDSLRARDARRIKIPVFVKSELLVGCDKSLAPAIARARIEKFIAPFEILPFDEIALEHYVSIRCELESKGVKIGPIDTLIAATARAHNATMVTNNTREFSRVPGLLVEDWTD